MWCYVEGLKCFQQVHQIYTAEKTWASTKMLDSPRGEVCQTLQTVPVPNPGQWLWWREIVDAAVVDHGPLAVWFQKRQDFGRKAPGAGQSGFLQNKDKSVSTSMFPCEDHVLWESWLVMVFVSKLCLHLLWRVLTNTSDDVVNLVKVRVSRKQRLTRKHLQQQTSDSPNIYWSVHKGKTASHYLTDFGKKM